MYIYQYLAITLLSILLFGCNSSSSQQSKTAITEETIYIDHYKTHCRTGPNGLCLRGKTNMNGEWYADIDWIQDFNYEWGHRYKVKIRKEKDSDPEAVGGGTNYFLLEILEDDIIELNTLFTLVVDERGNTALVKVDENLYSYEDEKLIVCKPEDCSVIEALQEQEFEVLIEVTYQESVDNPLMITQVLCAAPGGLMFNHDCPDED